MLEFTVFYVIFSFCFVFPPSAFIRYVTSGNNQKPSYFSNLIICSAFISVGLTVNSIFGTWLGSEDLQFIQYQLRRTSATIVVHSFLPLGYFVGLAVAEGNQWIFTLLHNSYSWLIFFNICVTLPLFTTGKVFLWRSAKWQTHPLVTSLIKYASNERQWTEVAAEINTEFRR